jgi:Ca2+-binding EF-hand superfamily protein
MASATLPPEVMAECQTVFAMLDQSKSGVISLSRLQLALASCGSKYTIAELKSLLQKVVPDTHNDNTSTSDGDVGVTLETFATILMLPLSGDTTSSKKEEIHRAFRAMDIDQDGALGDSDLAHVGGSAVVQEADLDNDGRVTVEDFERCLSLPV